MQFARRLRFVLATICLMPMLASAADQPPSVRLAANGKSLMPIVLPNQPTQRMRKIGGTLVDYLERISGAEFMIQIGNGKTGIAIGRIQDFPNLDAAGVIDLADAMHREDYRLISHPQGVYILGASELAVEYGVWDFLYRLGYRQYFPGPTWEIVPRTPQLAIAVDVTEHASYVSRDLGIGLGSWRIRNERYADWCEKNRLSVPKAGSSPIMSVGHAYLQIVADRKEGFAKHPEYFALVNGKRETTGEVKFCISNPGLRKLVADYAVDYFHKKPDESSVSLEPSDGLGWCECDACKKLGSVSDRVVMLMNEAAVAVRERHGDKKLLTVYAYSEHAPPPTIKVDPMVVVSVTTTLTAGNLTTEQLVEAWHDAGAQIGIREYYGVYPWDWDLPGKVRMANLPYLKRTTPYYFSRGARFMTAETSDTWGGMAGLGYYLTARMLWDVHEADRLEELTNDFFEKAYGPSRRPMEEFYRLTSAEEKPLLSGDLIGRMYRALAEAMKLTQDPAIVARIHDQALYTRYVELFREYNGVEGPERQQRYEDLMRFTYRIKDTGMEHTMGVWRGLPYYHQGAIKLPPGVGYEIPEDKDPWKNPMQFTPQEIAAFVTEGIAHHALNDFTPVTYSMDLIPADALALPNVAPGVPGLFFRDHTTFYTWAAKPDENFAATVKAGLLYQNLGDGSFNLQAVGGKETVEQIVVPPDQREREVRLPLRAAGLFRGELSDRSAGSTMAVAAGVPWTFPVGGTDTTNFYSRWTMYFYVPKGAKVVAGYSESIGELHDGDGHKVFTFSGLSDYFSVPVAKGQDGRLWRFYNALGARRLLTVPPYVARDSRELLLPREVIQADRPK